jgi:SagB-type dehydrogenase family enzyme
MQEMIHINPAIRIHLPSEMTQNRWYVEDFDAGRVFSVPEVVVVLLVYCIDKMVIEEIISEISGFYGYSHQIIKTIIKSLIEKRLILTTLEEGAKARLNSEYLYQKYELWNQFNWGAAAEYHFFTYDCKFLDYSDGADGWRLARQRMTDYSAKEPDVNRFKTYPEAFKRVILPWFFNNLVDDGEEIDNNKDNEVLDLRELAIITSFAFAKTAEVTIPWEGMPLIRRTSPSGGSRHPTEGYIIVLNVDGIDAGMYHIQSSPFCLVQLSTGLSVNIPDLFPAFYDDSGRIPSVIIIMSSIFERNMFRYREPRTFRTIHMDAGHILGTIELVANYLNRTTKVAHQFDGKEIEQLIGLDGLTEGFMTSIAIYSKKIN